MYHISSLCRYECMTDALTRVSGRAGKQFVSYWNKILNVFKETPKPIICVVISQYTSLIISGCFIFVICR